MTFAIKYKPFFQVNILHQYFLNTGDTEYSTMTEAEKEKQLTNYNLSNFFTVIATAETRRKLNGHNLVFKTFNYGFTVYAQVSESGDTIPFISASDTMELSFLLKQNKYTFINISNLELESAGKLFFFSNQKLSSEASNFPLIKKAGTTSTVNDKYTLNNVSLLHELEKLSLKEQEHLFGIVKIHMKGNSAGLNITTAQQRIRSPFQIFELNFANRKTVWRYIFNENQQVNNTDDVKKEAGSAKHLITKQKYPLTAKGFISIEHGGVELPNPDANSVKPSSTNNKIYSEIYM